MRNALLALTTILVTPAPVLPQAAGGSAPATADTTASGLATLSVWAEDVWVSLLDRDGSRHGRLAADGTFQRFDPLEDSEYGLDVRTGLFGPTDDARWARTADGLRVAGVSISHLHIVHVVDWRQEVPVADAVALVARYRRERSLTAARDYPRLAVRWRDALGSAWVVEARIGAHFFKPSADVELVASRTWAGAGGGAWELEAGVAALDAFSNTVFGTLGVREEDVEAHLDYGSAPLAARASLRRSTTRWRAELHAGTTNRSEMEVTFPATGDAAFTQRERARFAGVLLEVEPWDRLAVAAYGRLARAHTERASGDPSGTFALREETAAVGALQRLGLGGAWALEVHVERLWRPEERTRPAGGSVDHADRATYALGGLVREPGTGWTGRVGWAVLDREAGALAPERVARNHRLVVAGGWRFATGFEVTAGTGWDLDAFGRAPFDGGHLRLRGVW